MTLLVKFSFVFLNPFFHSFFFYIRRVKIDICLARFDCAIQVSLFGIDDAETFVRKGTFKTHGHNLPVKLFRLMHAPEESKDFLGLMRLGAVTERIADAAARIADVVLRGLEPHPVLRLVIEEAEETVLGYGFQENPP